MRLPAWTLLVGGLCGTACGDATPSEYDADGMTKEQRAADEAWGGAASRRRHEEWVRNAPRPAIVRAPRLRADTASLAATDVVPVASAPLPKGRNVLWCATWQVCWDALCDDVAKGPVVLGPPAPPEFSAAMNRREFPHEALDPASFLALSGRVKDGIVPRIRTQLRVRFGAEMLDPGPLVPESVVAYGHLRKSLPFEHLFEPRIAAISFADGKKQVAAFGSNPGTTYPGAGQALAQVTSWTGRKEREFILEFAVKGGKDRLLLAVIAPGATLRETWQATLAQVEAGPGRRLDGGQDLAVPKMNVEISHRFREILGARMAGEPSALPIVEARQTIGFSLDEGGADLQSHALLATGGIPKSLVVDRPFLVALLEKGAKDPYLLLWIANDELLAEAPR